MATKVGMSYGGQDPIERRRNVWVMIAKHMARKAVGYSARALEAHPHRPDLHELENMEDRQTLRARERERKREEWRRQREAESESPGAPWIYIPGLLKEGPSDRRRQREERAERSHRVSRSGATNWVIWIQIALILSLLAIPALAVEPREMLADPALEARARVIGQELRCLVCQNQSIDDSNAPLAADLRRLVRERLQAGDDNDAVLTYVTARYGDYVLLRPPVQGNTYLLWFGPLAVLSLGAAGVAAWFRTRRGAAAAEAPLSAEEERRLAGLLGAAPR